MPFIIKQHSVEMAGDLSIEWFEYKIEHYTEALFSNYTIQKPAQLTAWVKSRQAQFLAGRIAAKNALPSVQKNTQLAIGKYHQVLWPKGVVGSISHDKNVSIASTKTQTRGGLGIDIQSVFSHFDDKQINNIILSPFDQKLIKKDSCGWSDEHLMTLIFSAKESFFKAVFNQVNEYFDFNVVSVKSIDCRSKQLTLATDITLSESITQDKNFVVNYHWIDRERVITTLHFID